MSRWISAKVTGQKKWADGLYSIYITADVLPFTAGQFTQLAIEIDGKRVFRPYSFVNTPDENTFEFYYTLVKEGLFTPQLNNLKAGDEILIAQRAGGKFTMDEVIDGKNLWLFGSGTGFGVFLALLKTNTPWERFDNIFLSHSVRHTDHLTHLELIQSWQEQYGPKFHYIPIVTRDTAKSEVLDVKINHSRITDLLRNQQLENSLGYNLTLDDQVMLCGNPDMLKELQALLEARGLKLSTFRDKGQITIESYWKA